MQSNDLIKISLPNGLSLWAVLAGNEIVFKLAKKRRPNALATIQLIKKLLQMKQLAYHEL